MNVTKLITGGCGFAFVVFGILCLNSLPVISDFRRFGLEHFRVLAGILEIVGGIGLLVGLGWRPALLASSFGLALMMLVAFYFRFRVRDTLAQSAPSFGFMLANVYIFVRALSPSTRGKF